MKRYTEKTAAAVLGKLLRRTRSEARDALKYTWIDSAGRQCCCDGICAYRLRVPVAGLPDMPRHLSRIDLDRVFPDKNGLQAVELPALDDLAALIAADRLSKGNPRQYHYAFGEGLPVVNAKYLRDMMRLYPDAQCFTSGTSKPLLFLSAHGDGLLMPLHVHDHSPRTMPSKPAEKRTPVYSAAQFAARFAA